MRLPSRRWLLFLFALSACQHAQPAMPGMKIGKPYVISGKTYYPEYDPTYDKIGMASWYGPGFHGKYTASGEIFNQNDLTAAHPTLPMPSLVRVTNLQNGKSLIVRVNDRGPFKSNRIIDLSKKAAQILGIRSTSEVRVQYLKKETDAYIASLSAGGAKTTMLAYNDQVEDAKNASVLRSTEPQIVESDDASTHAGQVVSEAAPIMSVSAGNLGGSSATNIEDRSGHSVKTVALVQDAHADEAKAPVIPAVAHVSAVADAPPPKAPEPLPASASASVPMDAHGYLIQVGSFSEEKNARSLQSKLGGIAAFSLDRIDMNGKVWWRVRLGPLADKATAESALHSVRDAGLPDARIIRQ